MASDKIICGCDTIQPRTLIPIEVYNAEQERNYKERNKLTTIIIVLILTFVLTNGLWIYYFNQYDYEVTTETVTQDGDGINNYNTIIGGDCIGAKDNQKDSE